MWRRAWHSWPHRQPAISRATCWISTEAWRWVGEVVGCRLRAIGDIESPTLAADRTLRLQDYVCGFMKNVVNFVCSHSDSSRLNLLGYCMGGTMSAMYTALYPDQIKNLILMAAPIDFSGDESLLNLWTREENF